MNAGDSVIVSKYSSEWPQIFAAEAKVIRTVFLPDVIEIEHAGSTAVPGMDAKPTVDILLGATSLAMIEGRIEGLASLGYGYLPEREEQIPQRRYFRKPKHGVALFHLHAVELGSDFWVRHLAFRDALRNDPNLFREYLALKRHLAISFKEDRVGYTEAKAPFIQRVVDGQVRRAKDGGAMSA